MTRKKTEGLVALNVQGPGVHTAHTVTSIMTIREAGERMITLTETNTTSHPRVVDESEVATAEHRRRSPSPSANSAASISSKERGGSSRHRLRGKSPSHRSRSGSDSRDVRKSKSKHREKDRDKKYKKHKDRDNGKDKDERRSVLTGKKIKLKVHKDARDLEMDANRQNLLQFLNSTCE
ncbi:uncharacterized protein F5891DRAFT_1194924 [Suillus fuscotomentosus]|uniref:Uncharacterized protein n=1 Tax=Suillus fuscotomentosus TaxID=1912939 RepID=A0AAD4DVD8_9AGAM|nr:uncharacterized protein F5891DRAFT_1194924 [Suillus fuscotomentosus]KAG1894771.1 hypothetical protein F5891DRAFT_1194924 [Suillus fuscotomentosus]